MEKGFKFRYVNEITGIFVVLTVLAVVGSILFIANAQRWFAATQKLQILLPDDGSHGLREGAEVQMLGTAAGTVRTITIDPSGQMIAHLRLKQEFFPLVREDSLAIIRRRISLAPAVYLEISRGSGAPLPLKNPQLRGSAEKELQAVLTEILDQVKSATLPTLQEYTQLAAELRDPEGPFQALLVSTGNIAKTLDRGEGALPKLLRDKTLAVELEQTIKGANATLIKLQTVLSGAETTSAKLGSMTDNVNQQLAALPELMALSEVVLKKTELVMTDLRQATSQLPEFSAGLGAGAEGLPVMLQQATLTLAEIERLVLGLQKHWLVRGYVEPESPPGRIPPEQIEAGRSRP